MLAFSGCKSSSDGSVFGRCVAAPVNGAQYDIGIYKHIHAHPPMERTNGYRNIFPIYQAAIDINRIVACAPCVRVVACIECYSIGRSTKTILLCASHGTLHKSLIPLLPPTHTATTYSHFVNVVLHHITRGPMFVHSNSYTKNSKKGRSTCKNIIRHRSCRVIASPLVAF